MVTCAAFNILLAARTGRDDILIGTDFASRSRPEVARCIGFFVNELALRTSLAGDPDFRTLVRRVRHTAIDAYKHQHLPFQWLVENLKPPRDRSRTPVFQVVFDLHNVPLVLEFRGVTFSPIRLPMRPAKYDLTLFIAETPKETRALLEYNTDLYNRTTAQGLLSDYCRILAAAVANPNVRLSELVQSAVKGV
jgi:aspartate racemase